MTSEIDTQSPNVKAADDKKPLTPAAQRALAEAQARRAGLDARLEHLTQTPEIKGRAGPDPVRYDDWENRGIASDF